MSVYDIGRLCVKTMGREAGYLCVIVDIVDKNYLLIDGLKVRRRRVNYRHIEPIAETVDIKKGSERKLPFKNAKRESPTRRKCPAISMGLTNSQI